MPGRRVVTIYFDPLFGAELRHDLGLVLDELVVSHRCDLVTSEGVVFWSLRRAGNQPVTS
jgi:hypothetical protein